MSHGVLRVIKVFTFEFVEGFQNIEVNEYVLCGFKSKNIKNTDWLLWFFRAGALTVGLPPAWVDVSDEITANVQRARAKMGELAKAHAKALMPSFGDGKEDQHKIEALTHEITDLLKKSEKRLKRLSAGGTSEDSNIRKNVQVSL